MRNWIARYAAVAAFLFVALAAGIAINKSAKDTAKQAARVTYLSQVQSCFYSNEFRKTVNKRIAILAEQREVLLVLLKSARTARLATHTKADLAAARSYQRLIKQVKGSIHFNDVPIIQCDKVIKKP